MLNLGSDLTEFGEERTEFAVKNEKKPRRNQTFEGDDVRRVPTLPNAFKSLVGRTVRIETEEPRRVIESVYTPFSDEKENHRAALLGDLLGVRDYRTNKAAFWFLDAVALQILRYKDDLDDHYRSVLIGWLAGEMKLIRDRKLSREDFFKEMRLLFLYVADKLSRGDRLLHWELLVEERSKITSPRDPTVDEPAVNDEASVTNNLAEKSPRNSEVPLITGDSRMSDTFEDAIAESSSSTDPRVALDRIIEATYSMYANELRYDLVYEVFVTSIRTHDYYVPHTIRVPRQIKLANPGGGPFGVRLHERLEKTVNELTMSGRADKNAKSKNNARKELKANNLNTEIPPTPPPSLIDEEILADNRRFILPLVEAKEATQIFRMHIENT